MLLHRYVYVIYLYLSPFVVQVSTAITATTNSPRFPSISTSSINSSSTYNFSITATTTTSTTTIASLANSSTTSVLTSAVKLTPTTAFTTTSSATEMSSTVATTTAAVTPTVTPKMIPAIVPDVTVDDSTININGSNVTLTLSWGEPFNNLDLIVNYTVSCSGDDICPPNFTTTDNTTRSYTITNLTPMTNYTFSIVATNSIGSGEAGVRMITTPPGKLAKTVHNQYIACKLAGK